MFIWISAGRPRLFAPRLASSKILYVLHMFVKRVTRYRLRHAHKRPAVRRALRVWRRRVAVLIAVGLGL